MHLQKWIISFTFYIVSMQSPSQPHLWTCTCMCDLFDFLHILKMMLMQFAICREQRFIVFILWWIPSIIVQIDWWLHSLTSLLCVHSVRRINCLIVRAHTWKVINCISFTLCFSFRFVAFWKWYKTGDFLQQIWLTSKLGTLTMPTHRLWHTSIYF